MIGLIGSIVTALIGAWVTIKVREVHQIVNSQRTQMEETIRVLRRQAADVRQAEAVAKATIIPPKEGAP